MSLFRALEASASALTAERVRMEAIAGNLANANTTRGPGGPYRRKVVLFAPLVSRFLASLGPVAGGEAQGVVVAGIVEDPTPPRRVYDPGHPDADAEGFVTLPNVNPAVEMVDLIASARAYEANVIALNTTKQVILKALEIGRR
ncbi:MAG: flagellar basal body rod protein FlgC [Armatimonadota bacterium]|nr:flagellar basal body rod protein FlgC [Armatimonadota bacterium]MDR7439042.1 flagellar basal body rod protein FlgC [Armatimonadota bacterium]MDR7562476.1 flagellar basal body rod protein FlgC [Armatimonadota bacterium]MDR7566832.1 flagellar basal body rod protein FlgC [Armatimonadota bacterium]MDR7601189.1 flagellar basal body rod protein FlgC [Armatimonadota bacterium]